MSTSVSQFPSSSFGNDRTIPEWHKLFQAPVEEDDPIWTEYIKEAAVFDNKKIDEWNKAIDVVLVYVALFTGVVTTFVVWAVPQFQPKPADISNQLLVAIYKNQVAAMQNRSPDIIDTAALFKQDPGDYNNAVLYNGLLFADLAMFGIVSMITFLAKIWVINYNDKVNSSGSPYERAMKRQEAYSGVLAWKMGTIIDSLPFLLLIAIAMFGFFIHQLIDNTNIHIGIIIGTMLELGLVFVILASIVAAFIPACPFYSSLSTLTKLLFKFFPDYSLPERMVGSTLSRMKPGLVWTVSVTLTSVAVTVAMIICVIRYSSVSSVLICFPLAAALSISGNPPRSDQRPLKYDIRHWVILAIITLIPMLEVGGYYKPTVCIITYCAGGVLIALYAIIAKRMNKFTPDTREVDALAWLLKWAPSPKPWYFQKAAQISRTPVPQHKPEDDFEHRKALLLNSLLPLLSPLLTSKIRQAASEGKETEELAIYVACLAQLSDFTDSGKGSFLDNQVEMKHPSPPNPESLSEILKTLERSPNLLLKGAAKDALKYYRVKLEGETEKDD